MCFKDGPESSSGMPTIPAAPAEPTLPACSPLNSAVSGNAVFTVAFECTAPYHADTLREGILRAVLCSIAAISLTSFANETLAAEVAHAARSVFHCLTYGSGDARQS